MREQAPAQGRDGVFHPWRHLRIYGAFHQPVRLQRAQRDRQHFLRDVVDGFVQFIEAHNLDISQQLTDTMGMQKTEIPHAMSTEEVEATIQEYVQAAKNAITAGFDGVEIHAANGYLPNQFLNPASNTRTDDYGGSIEKRSRFVLEIARQVAEAIGSDKTGIRFSPYNPYNGMPLFEETFATYDYLTQELNKLGILYIHLLDAAARSSEEGLTLIHKIRENFQGILILNAGYTAARAAYALETEKADVIAFGTSFLANPDLPYRLENDLALNVPNPATFYTADAVGYTDYQPVH